MINRKSETEPVGLHTLVDRTPSIEAVDDQLEKLSRISTPREQQIVECARAVNRNRKWPVL